MNTSPSKASQAKKIDGDLALAFDVGHSSIGWAVLQSLPSQSPSLLGCGAVIFPADDCLASQRRGFRRQRRHVRATRQRIARLKKLLAHLAVLSRKDLDAPGCAWPWLLAARVLRGGELLTWAELWDVLRWYAHNRGYDGNKRWSAQEAVAEAEDTEKVSNARALYEKYGTHTMSETFCAVCGLDPLGEKRSCNLSGDKRPKAMNAAFPREDVEAEVRAILEKHIGVLPKLDAAFIRALFSDWRAIPAPGLKLPQRYRGGLLFGQLVPRFENRIIARCPITFERVLQQISAETGDAERAKAEAAKRAKVPAKECREFYEFRWAMQLANVMVATNGSRHPQRLIENENWRRAVDVRIRERGYFTPGEFKKAVSEATGGAKDNLGQMLLHPDAQKALLLDPVKKLISSDALVSAVWPHLSKPMQQRAAGKWRRGKTLTLAQLVADASDAAAIQTALQKHLDTANTKKAKRENPLTREQLLATPLHVERLEGRAPYHREILREAVADVMERGIHPNEETGSARGTLFRSDAIRDAQLRRDIDEQTNNHLVRHRLRILERLHADLLKAYAADDKTRIARLTIEVNRDLREFSGMTAKQIVTDFNRRLNNFKTVSDRLEKAFAGKDVPITPGLIRKARIAEDLGWKCPYTGKSFDEFDLLYRRVDKDHIIPRSDRPSDSLDSLVITFTEINRWKGKRTAVRFVEEEQSKPVPGLPHLTIKPLTVFQKDVEAMETFKGHDDDKRRKKNRKRLLQIRDFVEKEFVPADLTQTSQLVRLGAQALERAYDGKGPKPLSLPGSVTGAVRKSWDVLHCLASANPCVTKETTKAEVRDITHLHHALDACVLGFASIFLPGRGRDGGAWELLVKRRLNPDEQKRAREVFGAQIEITQAGELRLADLAPQFKEQIRQRLVERRVVQHVPAEMAGLPAQLNAWRVEHVEGSRAFLRQRMRQADGTRKDSRKDVELSKLIGLEPEGDAGKLKALKAALILDQNYGIAILDHVEPPEPPQQKGKRHQQPPSAVVEAIPYHKVWHRLQRLKERNLGKMPRVLRKGMLIHVPDGNYCRGFWRVVSIKNTEAFGLVVDVAAPDGTGMSRQNQKVLNLIRDGLQLIETPLNGIAMPQTPASENSTPRE